MNTRRVGSRSGCPANQSQRCLRTSERCCSSACADFFKGDRMAIEKAPKHGGRETLAAIGDHAFLDLQQRHVRPAANETQKIVAMGLYSTGTTVSPRRRRRDRPLGFEARHPAHRAGDADPKSLGRRVARHAAFHHRSHDTFAKIVGKRHPRRLLRTATIFKQVKADFGNPSHDSSIIDIANALAALHLEGGPGTMALWTVIILAIGALLGLVNGALVAIGRLPPIVVTVATLSIF